MRVIFVSITVFWHLFIAKKCCELIALVSVSSGLHDNMNILISTSTYMSIILFAFGLHNNHSYFVLYATLTSLLDVYIIVLFQDLEFVWLPGARVSAANDG